jgi:hypothetical protein
MDYSYQGCHPPPQLAAMVAQTNATLDDQWYANSGANAHITNELENLSIQQRFQGDDMVAVGNGSVLTIEHIGSSTLHSPFSLNTFHLKNVLQCPNATTKLLSIQRFCRDNSCYFILTAHYFYRKDLRTHAILLEVRSENGLYPIQLQRNSLKDRHTQHFSFTAFIGIKTSSLGWHYRLGHSSPSVLSHVLSIAACLCLQMILIKVLFVTLVN